MLFHVSLAADDPRHAAKVLAEIMGGEAQAFPFVGQGSWVALTGDERGTMIEIYPRGTEMHPAPGPTEDAIGIRGGANRFTPTHIAIATPWSREAVFAIGYREGWPVKHCRRGGKFDVIELWVEGCQLVEVLTGAMQAEYIEAVRIENWRAMVADFEAHRLAHAA
jgi:hypothetical protein